MSIVIMLLALLTPATALGAVYRCPGTGGSVTYTDRPCPGGSRVDIDSAPQPTTGAPTPGQDQSKPEQPPPPSESRSAPPPDTCPGIRLLSVQPYSYQSTSTVWVWGFPYQQVVRYQCAAIRLRTDAYYGLLRESVAERLRKRLFAVFADGSRVRADHLTLEHAPDRMGVTEKLGARACFGTGPVEIIRVSCH